jgi:hypothetical protein
MRLSVGAPSEQGEQRVGSLSGGGSIGFQGACGSTWILERDPVEPGRLVLAQVKNNLASLPPSLAFTVTQTAPAEAENQARTLPWHGPSPWSADQLLGASRGPGPRANETDRACRFLEKLLEDGRQSSQVIWKAGKLEGFSYRMLRKARDLLSIESAREGNGREHRAYWSLNKPGTTAPVTQKDAEDDLSRWLDPLVAAYPSARPLDED